jgi:lysophospholipase L1-like esterase
MITKKFSVLIAVLLISTGIYGQKKSNKSAKFHYGGRVEVVAEDHVVLIGSASSVSYDFEGDACKISLEAVDDYAHHNFVSLELDGQYLGRFVVEQGGIQQLEVPVANKQKKHHLSIYKATEAANGKVIYRGTTAKVVKSQLPKRKKIEFIGDSITCGYGNDTAAIPCGKGFWFDQHNGYLAYGPVLSRALGVDFVLSSVSGYGMYRNWNDDHVEQPNLPDVYPNLYLNKDNSKPYSSDFQPDLVSICLGTNDLSNGDGKKARLPFDQEKYIGNYVKFIQTVYSRYPKTKIILLNSPMVSGERNDLLVRCLKKVIAAFDTDLVHSKIQLFEFQAMTPAGCGYHPSIEDDVVMANQLQTVFKKLVDEK